MLTLYFEDITEKKDIPELTNLKPGLFKYDHGHVYMSVISSEDNSVTWIELPEYTIKLNYFWTPKERLLQVYGDVDVRRDGLRFDTRNIILKPYYNIGFGDTFLFNNRYVIMCVKAYQFIERFVVIGDIFEGQSKSQKYNLGDQFCTNLDKNMEFPVPLIKIDVGLFLVDYTGE